MDFFSSVPHDLRPQAHQWASRVYFGQERIVLRKTLQYVPLGARCLDWGCGNGHFSYFLASSGYDVTAYSLNEKPELLQDTKFTKGTDPVKLPFPSASFNAVFGVGVLEHVHEQPGGNPRESLAELRRVLKQDGRLLLFHLPNKFSWIESARRVVNAPHHEKRFSALELKDLFRGFRVVESGRYHFLPRRALNLLPVKDSQTFCSAVDLADDVLSTVLSRICQNWYFVLAKS